MGTHKRFTRLHPRIIKLYKEGYSVRQIALTLDVSFNATRNYLDKIGLRKKQTVEEIRAVLDERICQLYDKTQDIDETVRIISRDRARVEQALKAGRGLDFSVRPNTRMEKALMMKRAIRQFKRTKKPGDKIPWMVPVGKAFNVHGERDLEERMVRIVGMYPSLMRIEYKGVYGIRTADITYFDYLSNKEREGENEQIG